MPIGSLYTAKESAETYQPLLLATVVFTDGTSRRFATHGLGAAYGTFQYAGQNYEPRLLNSGELTVQALSDTGADVPPSATLVLNDGDRAMLALENAKGFRGAIVVLSFVLWDAGANDFSSDSISKFTGVASAASVEETTLSIPISNILNLAQVQLPTLRIQKRCPWIFPRTNAERLDAVDNADSWFHECGYAPDHPTAPRGNLIASAPYTSCDYRDLSCRARGMFDQDSAARVTGRFGGIQWEPQGLWSGRSYFESKFVQGENDTNEAKYGEPVPLVYGDGWIEPVLLNRVGDPNTQRFELLLGYGEFEAIDRVIVNDHEVPAATTMDHASLVVADPNFAWYLVNRGDRNGAPNALPGYAAAGDPYGSMCVICVVIPNRIANGSPRVRVLARGPKLRIYTDATTHSVTGGVARLNPVWQLMDVLVWSGWRYSQLDTVSFINAAGHCDEAISYQTASGGTSTHARYMSAIAINKRRSAADLVRGIRTNADLLLRPNGAGKIEVVAQSTLAKQQPGVITGSNYTTPVASVLPDGTAANGYVAYKFDPSNIIRSGSGSPVKVEQRRNSELPSRVAVSFQDIHNNFSPDSATIVDTDGLIRSGEQDVNGSLPVDGLINQDQAYRIVNRFFARNAQGNPRGDSGGTLELEFETSFRAVHLRMGDLVLFDYPQLVISNQLFRVLRVQATTNYRTCRVRLQWHEDDWYRDDFGQIGSTRRTGQGRTGAKRAPWPLLGSGAIAGPNPDPLFGREGLPFLNTVPVENATTGLLDGTRAVFGYLTLPVSSYPGTLRPPYIPIQGHSTAPTGGQLGGGRAWYLWLCSKSSTNKLSPPSAPARVEIPAGTDTNTVTFNSIEWPDDATGHVAMLSDDSGRPVMQIDANTTPALITFSAFDLGLAVKPAPDPEFAGVTWRVKRGRNLGVFAAEVTAATASTITVENAYWTVNEWAGRDVTALVVQMGGGDTFPQWNFRVLSNTADTLTIDTVNYSPDASGLLSVAGDRALIVMRTKPTAWTANSITDPKFNNTLALEGVHAITDATNASPIVITTEAHGYITGDFVRVDDVGGNTAANGVHQIAVINADTFSLDGSTGSGAYTSGGTARRLTGGLSGDEAKGKLLRIVAGTGRGRTYRIVANTADTITIDGEWIETPDATTRYITEEPTVEREIHQTQLVTIADFYAGSATEFPLDLDGLENQALVLIPAAVNARGEESLEFFGQVREIYCWNDLGGLASSRGGQMNLSVNGTLAIGSDQAPRASFATDVTIHAITAEVKDVPTGDDIEIVINADGVEIHRVEIADGLDFSTTPLYFPISVPANQNISIDLVRVGTTFGGSDLTVQLRAQ